MLTFSPSRIEDARAGPLVAPPLAPSVALPEDGKLPDFRHLFDSRWVWQARCAQLGGPDEVPELLRIHQLRYRPGKRVVASYVAQRDRDRWSPDDMFTVEMSAGEPARIFGFPEDPHLPGLAPATSPADAADLMSQYVRIRPHSLRVDVVRYRPTSRAVLRNVSRWRSPNGDKLRLFVRVIRPSRVSRLLEAADLVEASNFALPRFVACWAEGGVVWLGHMPGDNVRTLIRNGRPPDPHQILGHLEQLWSGPLPADTSARDLARELRTDERLLSQVLQDHESSHTLRRVVDALGPFAAAWRPTALAHNDFYDDQMVLLPTGRLALVDFEETGPGDPMLDVGTMVAHLRWMAHFGTASEACDTFRRDFLFAAQERFGWDTQDLRLREAFALFRLCTNPVRKISDSWR